MKNNKDKIVDKKTKKLFHVKINFQISQYTSIQSINNFDTCTNILNFVDNK